MFTDIVASTALLERFGPEAADKARRSHFSVLRGALAGHGGREVKNLGDGLMVVFPSAVAAVAAAVDMQRRVRSPNLAGAEPLDLRVGIAAGDADVDGQDFFGRPVVEAARLCAVAEGGQVLVTELLRLLVGGRGPYELVPAGDIELKGFDAPVTAYEVRYPAEQLVGPDDGMEVPLPGLLALQPAVPFVARAREWESLEAVWAGVRAGQRRVVLVSGDAGTGKTRLAGEFARAVHRRGAAVLFGASTQDVEVPFQPFVQALTQTLEPLPGRVRLELGGPASPDLAPLLPHLFAALNGPGRTEVDAPTERYRLFEAVTTVLANLTRRVPVVFVLDDMHWARRPTIQLLDHLVRSTRLAQLALIVTYRDARADVEEPLHEALGDLHRAPGVDHLRLGGFDRAGVLAFVEAVTGHAIEPATEPLLSHLFAATDGNAFLLEELWRHLVDVGSVVRTDDRWSLAAPLGQAGSPEGVRQVVARRVARLPGPCRTVLQLAAVAGVECELSVLAHAAGVDETDTTLDAIEPAIEARLLDEVGPGRLRFTHALVRQAVEDDLPATTRRRHHAAVARALEHVRPDALDDLAHHFTAAVPLVPARVAIEYARRAAARASEALAHDNAVTLLASVLDFAEGLERVDVLLDLAAAKALTANSTESHPLCSEAAFLARQFDDHAHLVRAAVVASEAAWRGMVSGPAMLETKDLLREALLGTDDPTTRARLLGGLSAAIALEGDIEGAVRTGDEAISLARSVGDQRVLLVVMHNAVFIDWRPDTASRLGQITEEAVSLARAAGDHDAELKLVLKLLLGLHLSGDGPRLRAELARYRHLAGKLRQPFFELVGISFACIAATNEGRFSDAEALADEFRAGTETSPADVGGYGVQMFTIRREQGRLSEMRPMLEVVARLGRHAAAWRPGLAASYAEVGLYDEARAILNGLVADDLGSIPRDSLWAGVLTFLADACAFTRHRRAAEVVYRHLLPYKGLIAGMTGLAYYGAADRYLGKLAEVRERPADAIAHLEAALTKDEAVGWPVWAVHSRYELGRLLAERGRGQDRARSEELLGDAFDGARNLGMVAVATRCRAALDATRDRAHPQMKLTGREIAVLRLVAEGRTNQEIGDTLHTSRHTVANQVRAVLLKTGCANRTEAAAWGHAHGLMRE